MNDKRSNGGITNGVDDELGVILGLDGGTTSTICVCIPFSGQLADPVPVLARAAAGCSNHNSVGGSTLLFFQENPLIISFVFV